MAIAAGITCISSPQLHVVSRIKSLVGICVALIPYCLWLWRTWYLSGTMMGPREHLPNPDMLRQFDLAGSVLGHWFLPHLYFESLGHVVAALFLIVSGCFLARAFVLQYKMHTGSHSEVFRTQLLIFSLAFVLGHFLLTVLSAYRYYLDVNERTLFPVYCVVLLVFAYGLESIRKWLVTGEYVRCRSIFEVILVVYGVFWFAAPNALVDLLLLWVITP